jgi:hypothetical protein
VWELSLYHDRDWGPLGHRSLPPGLHAKGNGKINPPKADSGRGQGNGKYKKAS